MSKIPYMSAVDSLTYIKLYSWPYIFYVVGKVSYYQSNPGLEY